jgi:hypothetical protein
MRRPDVDDIRIYVVLIRHIPPSRRGECEMTLHEKEPTVYQIESMFLIDFVDMFLRNPTVNNSSFAHLK